jgi:hypothetical protein
LPLVVLAGCVTAQFDRSQGIGSPTGKIDVAEVPVRGFVVRVDFTEGGRLEGELLAVEPSWIYLSNGGEGPEQVVPVRLAEVSNVEIRDIYWTPSAMLAIWSVVGTISTLSHGVILIFSAPVWVGTGIATSLAAASGNDLTVSREDFPRLVQYARFPAGLPEHWSRIPSAKEEEASPEPTSTSTLAPDLPRL